jgi:hypothetical protein
MKKRLAALAVFAALTTACYGSYSAFNAVHKWNGKATNSKVGNSAIHFLLWVVPVYELTLIGDFLIFNNIEFLTDEPVFK